MRGSAIIVIAVALLVAGAPAPALAQGAGEVSAADRDMARKRFEEAEAHKRRGDQHAAQGETEAAQAAYGEAAEAYTRAFELYAHSAFIYNLAQMRRLRGEARKAIRAYETYLVLEPGGARAEQARQFIAELTLALDSAAASTQVEPAESDSDAAPAEPAPEPAREPGASATGSAPDPGEPARDTGPERGPAAGASMEPARALPPVDAPRADGSQGRELRIAGMISAAVGLAGLGLGVKLGLDAQAASDNLSRKPPEQPWGEPDRRLIADGQRAERDMIIALSAGGTALVAGGVLYFLGRPGDATTEAPGERPSVTAAPAPGGIQVTVSGRF